MATHAFGLPDLTRLLRECAGEDSGVDLEGEILDTPFAELEYDSLALLEVASRVERELGVTLAEDAVGEAETPRLFLEVINESAAAKA
jgi:act minimal PKS acyl carrier protein